MDNGTGGLSLGGLVSGGEMIDEFIANRTYGKSGSQDGGTNGGAQDPTTPTQQQPNNDEVNQLKAQLLDLQRSNQEMRSTVDRTNGSYQTLMQQLQHQQQSQQQQQVQLPELNIDDPDLAVALNTLEARLDHKLNAIAGATREQQMHMVRNMETQRFSTAVDELKQQYGDFGTMFTPQALNEFAAPYLQDPRFAGKVNWKHELSLAYKANQYDQLNSKYLEAQKKLESADKKQTRERETQKNNLKQVPGLGGRGGAPQGGVLVGEQILQEARANRKRLSFKQFGAELRKRSAL